MTISPDKCGNSFKLIKLSLFSEYKKVLNDVLRIEKFIAATFRSSLKFKASAIIAEIVPPEVKTPTVSPFSVASNISVLFNGPTVYIVFAFFFIACYCHKKVFSTLCSFEVSATHSNMIFDVSACFIYLQRFFCAAHMVL